MSIKEPRKRASGKSPKRKIPPPEVVPQGAIRNPRVRAVIDFMNANLHRSIRSSELAKVAEVSSSHLSYLFTDQTGLPPGKYLRRLRMEKARHLLATSLLRIKQIMAAVGYNNKGHFSRHFKRYFELAPSEYRRSTTADGD